MSLPMSRRKINELGQRLAASPEISAWDDQLLEELIARHLECLHTTRPRLDGLAEIVGTQTLNISHRPKTTGTIIDKLRRQDSMPLATMQDLAGFRVVGAFTFAEQDMLADEVARRFPADPREPKIRNRRNEPSYGYRAVHVVVSFDGCSIEVQVRTLGQHLWADLMERLGDRLGRQIRYGGPPVPPPGGSMEAAELIVSAMMRLSEDWAEDEPDIPADVVNRLEEFTESMWDGFVEALAGEGIDLLS